MEVEHSVDMVVCCVCVWRFVSMYVDFTIH